MKKRIIDVSKTQIVSVLKIIRKIFFFINFLQNLSKISDLLDYSTDYKEIEINKNNRRINIYYPFDVSNFILSSFRA